MVSETLKTFRVVLDLPAENREDAQEMLDCMHHEAAFEVRSCEEIQDADGA